MSFSASPILLFEARYSSNTLTFMGGSEVLEKHLRSFFYGQEGTGGSELAAGVGGGVGQPGSGVGHGAR
jgi:hypothetical protein